ncbi:tyrosine-type recombinase/integrase [Castellaniella sp. UC4442_H9]
MNDHRRLRLVRNCPTLAAALERYLADVSVRKKSHTQEQSVARIWLRTGLASRNLARITALDLQRLRDHWLSERKPGTVNRRLALLSHLYTVARKEWGLHWLANPVQLVTRPVVDDARDRRLFTRIRLNGLSPMECPRSELDWLIRATRSEALPTILRLASETAMRRSEIVMLRREQIDLTHGVVTLVDTKNGDTRYVPLSPFARDALRKWLAGRPMRGRVFNVTPGAATRAFARARDRARGQYEVLCKQHGRRPVRAYFVDLRLHDLRHEATTILSDVYPAHALAKVTGHRDTRMLLRYYNPRGRDLAQQLMRSKLGRWQSEQLRLAA